MAVENKPENEALEIIKKAFFSEEFSRFDRMDLLRGMVAGMTRRHGDQERDLNPRQAEDIRNFIRDVMVYRSNELDKPVGL